ncbi:hypothetical protein PWT90_05634 [Aphanocladium album]|nr:hypothetical protein PWT90_05634 [Aphanocladium album]
MSLKLSALWLMLSAAATALDCKQSYPGPENPNFETGNLQGWTVLSGEAFGDASVSDSDRYFDGPFHQQGRYFLWGYQKGGDGPVGRLRSSTFRASSVMSFLVGGGYNPDKLYIGLVRERDGEVLLRQTGMDDESMIRIVWDTSAWAGENVYMIAVDEVDGAGWGHINLDDVRVGCDALGDGNLTFTVMGQANQRSSGTAVTGQNACQLYGEDPVRPQYHYTPHQGWINDPCGLILYKGQHHRFAQYNPRAAVWGPMHWSHAVSRDGVHLEPQDVALYPPYLDDPTDMSGRFTGSAIADPVTGDLRLFFTEATDTGRHRDATPETQWTATSRDGGASFDYFGGNPILAHPPDNSGSGFRDPGVFFNQARNTWQMVVGSGDSRSGKILLYEAPNNKDMLTWHYVGVLYQGDGSEGTMYECPNFFAFGDKWVLIFGANGRMIYHAGTFDGRVFRGEVAGLVDHGPAGYAGQVYRDDLGRPLLVTWMATIGAYKMPSRVNGWVGQHSVTRELFLNVQGRLGSRPLDEQRQLHVPGSQDVSSDGVVDGAEWYLGASNSALVNFYVNLRTTTARSFTIKLFASDAEAVKLTYTVAGSKLTLDTTSAGYGPAGVYEVDDVIVGDDLYLTVLLDRSTLEIFTQHGTAMSASIFPRYQESRKITIQAEGGTARLSWFSLKELGSAWC